MNDWDYDIGHWLKDIPYIWTNAKQWEECKRVYILPSFESVSNIVLLYAGSKQSIYTFSTKYDVTGLDSKLLKLTCRNFFLFADRIIFDDDVSKRIFAELRVRMNGIPVIAPFIVKEQGSIQQTGPDFCTFLEKNGVKIRSLIAKTVKLTKDDILLGYPSKFKYFEIPKEYQTPYRQQEVILEHEDDLQSRLSSTLWLDLLREKHSGVCLPLFNEGAKHAQGDDYFLAMDTSNVIIEYDVDTKDYAFKKPYLQLYIDVAQKCMALKEIRYIVLAVTFVHTGGVDNKDVDSHANVAIIDKKEKTLHAVDPQGMFNNSEYIKGYGKIIEDILKESLDEWKIIPVDSLCPRFSFQSLENQSLKRKNDRKGFCEIWSYFIIDTILSNPGEDISSLLHGALAHINSRHGSFDRFIRSYMKIIEDKTKNIISRGNVKEYILERLKTYYDTLGVNKAL